MQRTGESDEEDDDAEGLSDDGDPEEEDDAEGHNTDERDSEEDNTEKDSMEEEDLMEEEDSMEEDEPEENSANDVSMADADDSEGESKDALMHDAAAGGACGDEGQDFMTLPELATNYPSFVLKKDWTPAPRCVSPETQMIDIFVDSLDIRRVTDHRTLLRMCRLLQLGGQPPLKAQADNIPQKLAYFIEKCSKLMGCPFDSAELARDWRNACKDIKDGEVWRPLADALFAEVFKRLCSYNAVTKWFERSNFKVTDWAAFCHISSQGHVEPRSRAEVSTTYENLFYWQTRVDPISDEKEEESVEFTSKPFLQTWFKDGRMRTYNKVDCIAPSKTGRNVPPGVFNSWPDFRAEKLPEIHDDQVAKLIKPVLEHFGIVVCANEEEVQYLLAWLAQQVQDPANKSQVGIILLGDQGVGKDIIFTWYIKYLLGMDVGLQVGKVSHIFGEHSTALQNKVLCVLDEADPATLKPHMSNLKDKMTAETLSFNPKEKKEYTTENIFNILITTNDTKNPVPLEPTDRRFVAFACNDSKRGDTAYFNQLGKHLNDTTARAFYQFLLKFDLSEYGSFQAKRPETQMYRQLKEMNMPVFYTFLSRECTRCAALEPKFVTSGSMFLELKKWAKDANFDADSYSVTHFGIDFTQLMKKKDTGVSKKRGESGNMYRIDWSKLEKCLKGHGLFNPNV